MAVRNDTHIGSFCACEELCCVLVDLDLLAGGARLWLHDLADGYDDESLWLQPLPYGMALHAEDIRPDSDRARQDRLR